MTVEHWCDTMKGIVSTDGDSLMTIIVILTQQLQYTLVEMFEKNPRLNQQKQEQTDRCSCLSGWKASSHLCCTTQFLTMSLPQYNPKCQTTQKYRYRLSFTHTCTHTHTHTQAYTHTQTHTQAHTHTNVCTHTRTHTLSWAHTHTHARTTPKRGWGLGGWQGCTCF